jgi:outer membrane cobalamin receptor
MNQFVSENNWLGNDVNLKNTVQSSNIYGGLKGSNERNFDFEMKFGYSEFSNLGFFTAVQGDSSRYNVTYAGGDKKVQVVNISGQINYQILNEVLSILKYDFNSYENLGELEKPYHRPAINLSFTNSITFKDRIIVSPDVFYLGGLYGFNPSQQKAVKMPDIIDLNLKVNYLITKKFNASVSANNILGKMNQRYLFYPQQSLNYTVGIAYSF